MKSNYFLCCAITVFIFLGLTKVINIENCLAYIVK